MADICVSTLHHITIHILFIWYDSAAVLVPWCIKAPRHWQDSWCCLRHRGHPFIWAAALLCDRGLPLCEPTPAHVELFHLASGRRPSAVSAAPSMSDVTASYDAVAPSPSRGIANETSCLTLWIHRCVARVHQSDDPADHLSNTTVIHCMVSVCLSSAPPTDFLY